MTKFIDTKKKSEIKIDNSFILHSIRTIASGATLPIMGPNVDWKEIDQVVGTRQAPRNQPLGVVFTKPDVTKSLLETVWEDSGDNGQHDGDMTLFEEQPSGDFNLTRLSPTEVKKMFPMWHPYHHEDKGYLK